MSPAFIWNNAKHQGSLISVKIKSRLAQKGFDLMLKPWNSVAVSATSWGCLGNAGSVHSPGSLWQIQVFPLKLCGKAGLTLVLCTLTKDTSLFAWAALGQSWHAAAAAQSIIQNSVKSEEVSHAIAGKMSWAKAIPGNILAVFFSFLCTDSGRWSFGPRGWKFEEVGKVHPRGIANSGLCFLWAV